MLKNKHIVLGVTGGIAAYKIPFVVREFVKGGADVRVVMTESAREFVTPMTLSTLSRNDVIVGTFPRESSGSVRAGTWHITLAEWGHLMLIAPATANTLAKLAHGIADDAVSTLALAFRKQVVVAPAMDLDMWEHQSTQQNISRVREMGYMVLPPEAGELASGLIGPGRLPEIASIVSAVEKALDNASFDFKGKKLLITAGPTYEAVDPVRFIGNYSSGKMGFALANAAAQRGASVTLVAGSVSLATPRNVNRIDVASADEMYRAVMRHRAKANAVIMAAAVADFKPSQQSARKIRKEQINGQVMTIELTRTKDILHELGQKKNGAVVVGFALETDRGLQNARRKLKEKNADLIILNNALTEGAGFATDTNIVTILSRRGRVEKLRKMSKFDVANAILDRVKTLL